MRGVEPELVLPTATVNQTGLVHFERNVNLTLNRCRGSLNTVVGIHGLAFAVAIYGFNEAGNLQPLRDFHVLNEIALPRCPRLPSNLS